MEADPGIAQADLLAVGHAFRPRLGAEPLAEEGQRRRGAEVTLAAELQVVAVHVGDHGEGGRAPGVDVEPARLAQEAGWRGADHVAHPAIVPNHRRIERRGLVHATMGTVHALLLAAVLLAPASPSPAPRLEFCGLVRGLRAARGRDRVPEARPPAWTASATTPAGARRPAPWWPAASPGRAPALRLVPVPRPAVPGRLRRDRRPSPEPGAAVVPGRGPPAGRAPADALPGRGLLGGVSRRRPQPGEGEPRGHAGRAGGAGLGVHRRGRPLLLRQRDLADGARGSCAGRPWSRCATSPRPRAAACGTGSASSPRPRTPSSTRS